jgi:DMSO reductase anchor subunit
MHPAKSLIAFTTLSGIGFGLMAWLGVRPVAHPGWVVATFALLAYLLAGGGLLLSLLHLGNPRRFPKAFTQWRSSWLSREAWAASVTMAAFALYVLVWMTIDRRVPALGWVVAILALVTVATTAMIYASLRTVPRWSHPLTPAVFVAAALAGGALLVGAAQPAIWSLAALAILQSAHWLATERLVTASGLASATGLGGLGSLRPFEPPHTGPNYVTREMVYRPAGGSAAALRALGLSLAALLPLALLLLFPFKHNIAAVIVGMHLVGMVLLRWLFFAQAEHVVGLYYGRR